MLNFSIRKPTNKEIIDCINVLYSSFRRPSPEDIKEEERIWKALIKSKIGEFLISEDNRKIFGIGGVFLFGKVSSFGYMAVLPEYRGKGVGTEIFRNLLKIANIRNCKSMILYASELGRPIYEKFGFRSRFYGTMYQLPMRISEIGFQRKNVKVIENLPRWLLNLDENAMGFNRERYLNLKVELGAKILVVENEGYGLVANKRLGPLIAINQNSALRIIKTSIDLGANHLIIANHKNFPKRIIKSMNLIKKEDASSIKMVYGRELSENLDLLYCIGTYAKG
ncbi:MAG: GNAT family N-acetyltransferase [Promethearchaeota archaeon]